MSVNLDVPFCVILAPKPCLPAPPSPPEPPVPSTPGEILPWAAAHFDFHPDPVQAEFLATPHRRVVLCCHRQWGKSTVAALKAVHHALSRPGASVLVCSPTLRQSGQFLAKMLQFFFALGLKTRSHSLIPNCLVLPNGARVIAVPALERNLRGFTATLLIIDEAAAVSDDVFYALRPTLAATNGDVIILSTPRGQVGFFHDVWHDLRAQWHRIRATAAQNPRISKEFLDEERQTMPKPRFQQEYLCEFVPSGPQIFDRETIEALFTDKYQPWFPEKTT
jgi:hypothetical protein